MVAFGTGRSLTEGDRTDTDSKQTVYSVLDNTRYKISLTGENKGKVVSQTSDPTPATVSRSQLMSQMIEGAKKVEKVQAPAVISGRSLKIAPF